MIACMIRYDIDPFKREQFEAYARMWSEPIPACGADLIGYFAPHEGSLTTGYGLYTIESLAAYEAYKAKLARHPGAQEAFACAKREQFIRREDRLFLKPVPRT